MRAPSSSPVCVPLQFSLISTQIETEPDNLEDVFDQVLIYYKNFMNVKRLSVDFEFMQIVGEFAYNFVELQSTLDFGRSYSQILQNFIYF